MPGAVPMRGGYRAVFASVPGPVRTVERVEPWRRI